MSTTVRPAGIDTAKIGEEPVTPASRKRSGLSARFWTGVTVVLLVAVIAWQGAAAFSPNGPGGASSSVYTVVRRSFPVTETVKGELKAARTQEIKSKVEGRATIIWLIEEGKTVKEGDLLVRLASDKIEERVLQEEANLASAKAANEAAEKDLEILIDENLSNIRKAELAVHTAEIELRKYIEGDARKALVDAELGLERAHQQFEAASLNYDADKSLRDQGFITKAEMLESEFKLEEAKRAIEKAELSLRIFNKYEFPKERDKRKSDHEEAIKDLERVKKSALAKEAQKYADVEAKKAKLMNTENQLKKYRKQLELCEIRAPAPGLVVYFSGHRYNPQHIAEGAEVYERQTIVTLPDPSLMIVNVRIHEAKTHKIKLGQHVNVEVESIPDRIFTGKITKIAPLADSRNQWLNPDLKEYETEITLDQTDPALKPGVTARAEIIVSQQENVTCVPLQAVYSKGGYHYVFRADGRDGEPVEVQVGESSDEVVAIASGLNVNDRILLAVSDAAKAKLPDREPRERTDDVADLRPPEPRRPPATRHGRGDHAKRRGRTQHGAS